MTEAEESELKTRLRLKWIPWDEGFDPVRADEYERFLSLHVDEQTDIVRKMSAEEGALYIYLSESRIQYGKA
ncbi:hypothetical protein NN6n1_35800 [Shinella zoogloeoides]